VNNYEYCANFVAARLPALGGRVLDYGCGAGKIVSLLRSRGVDASGCDVFYEGGDYSVDVPGDMFGTVIRRMEGNRIPFDSASFDWVINNQVLEHVPDLDVVVSEIRRVLKPGGFVLSVFPDRGVWREGHCGIPFLHRFRRGSRLRVWYGAAMRAMGFGYHKEGRSFLEWSENFCRWLDAWTHYRSYNTIRSTFGKSFSQIHHYEEDWLAKRLGKSRSKLGLVPVWSQRLMVRKLMGLVFVSSGLPASSNAPRA
jgi:SAM-dependent methyltransferase